MASSKEGNQASFGSKKSPYNVSRRDGDWTCTTCGYLNFSFRIVCHQTHCNAPRPSVSLATQVMNPFRNDHHLPCYHGGVATPLPLYGIPSILGSPIPYFYLQNDNGIYLIPSISLGCFGGTHVGPLSREAGVITNNFASHPRRRGPNGLSKGEWICPKCEYVNFAFRTKCNIKHCRADKPKGPKQPNRSIPEGSWTCKKCGNLNYPFRSICNRRACRSEKTASAS